MRSGIIYILLMMTLASGCRNPGIVSEENARKGEILFNSVGCTQCHSVKGDTQMYGPPLNSIYKKEVVVFQGEKKMTVTIDRNYIIRSIADPGNEKLEGYQDKKMPPINLSPGDIQSLADYLIYISGEQHQTP